MKSDTSRNILLIALAVRLQRLVKHLPNQHVSAERISRKSLGEAYFSEALSASAAGAHKKASRYMDEMDKIFGLNGSESSGYVMAKKFNTFRDMFEFWLKKINPPEPGDKRLHVMLTGLIYAIDNAFSSDPIVIPQLARQIKQQYGNKNIRDTREPLTELFDNSYIANYLQLCEDENDTLFISPAMDPLLLRLRSRAEVGGNADKSISLARPGRIHVIFDHTISGLQPTLQRKTHNIAEAVCNSHIWRMGVDEFLPYLLCREGQSGPIILTMRNLNEHCFENVPVTELPDKPVAARQYIPLNLDLETWKNFRQLIA